MGNAVAGSRARSGGRCPGSLGLPQEPRDKRDLTARQPCDSVGSVTDLPPSMAPTPLERLDLYTDTAGFLEKWAQGDAEGAAGVLAEWSEGSHPFVWSLAHLTHAAWHVMQEDPALSYAQVVQVAAAMLTDALGEDLRQTGRLAAEPWSRPGEAPDGPQDPDDGPRGTRGADPAPNG
jgi:hypothetical protein